MNKVNESISGPPRTLELRKKSNSTANAYIFVTVTYSYEVASDFLGSFCPTCARGRCHFCMGIFLKSLHYVIWIVYLINIHYVTIYDDYIVIICNNNNSTGSNERGRWFAPCMDFVSST